MNPPIQSSTNPTPSDGRCFQLHFTADGWNRFRWLAARGRGGNAAKYDEFLAVCITSSFKDVVANQIETGNPVPPNIAAAVESGDLGAQIIYEYKKK